ncbi:MAG: hypothetical protein MZV64_32955 [Ignavibacteriales bacterium]|nr:hypothetical protein [Ignavibacteriales bacterium]
MAEKMRETFTQNVIINVDESVLENMEMGKQGVIFYIIEEAVNNARKHASAAHIWVRLRPFEKEIALLEIEDDGIGLRCGGCAQILRQARQPGDDQPARTHGTGERPAATSTPHPARGRGFRSISRFRRRAADRLHHARGGNPKFALSGIIDESLHGYRVSGIILIWQFNPFEDSATEDLFHGRKTSRVRRFPPIS